MRIRVDESAGQVFEESTLLKRFESAAKVGGSKVEQLIAVKNDSDQVRLVVTAQSEAEADKVEEILGKYQYNDELVVDYEEIDEHGGVECWAEVDTHPEYTCIFSRKPPRLVRTKVSPDPEG